MIFQEPPGAIVHTLAQKAAWDRGYRQERDTVGPWLSFASTTAPGDIWIAGIPPKGPFALSVGHPGVAADLATTYPPSPIQGPGGGAVLIADDAALTHAIDRAWKLAMSLPTVPLEAFRSATDGLPRKTEAERLVIQRIGQDKFRDALMLYWGGRCPLTGITDPALLRASHIIPWAECTTDAERLDAGNGLLLSALWDAAFDAFLITFDDEGAPIASPRLSTNALAILNLPAASPIHNLTPAHRARLALHRAKTLG